MQKLTFLSSLMFLLALWFIWGTGLARSQTEAWVDVSDTSLESGKTYQMVTVFLENDVPIKGIQMTFDLGRPAETDFTTDTIIVQIDTLSLEPLETDTTVVRQCEIQTAGTLVENFQWITAHGTAGDTVFLDCDRVVVAGMAQDDQPVPPGSGVLFKLYLDVLCIPDTTQDRTAYIMVNGFLSDSYGQMVETEFNFGTLFLDLTLCGDLEECLCGDVDADGEVSIVDAVYIVNWLFKSGPNLCPEIMGNINLHTWVTIADVVYLINYLLRSGADPDCTRYY